MFDDMGAKVDFRNGSDDLLDGADVNHVGAGASDDAGATANRNKETGKSPAIAMEKTDTGTSDLVEAPQTAAKGDSKTIHDRRFNIVADESRGDRVLRRQGVGDVRFERVAVVGDECREHVRCHVQNRRLRTATGPLSEDSYEGIRRVDGMRTRLVNPISRPESVIPGFMVETVDGYAGASERPDDS